MCTMVILKKKILLLAIFCLFFFHYAESQITNLDYFATSIFSLKYHPGKKLLFVNHVDTSNSTIRYTQMFLLDSINGNRMMTNCENAFIGVLQIKISYNQKYMAFTHCGEGHTWIEIYNLEDLLQSKFSDPCKMINPYPGNLSIDFWNSAGLCISSDINLQKLGNKELNIEDLLDNDRQFLYNIENDQFIPYKPKK